MPAKRFLAFYAASLTSVEVNYTFGSRLKPGQLQGWLDAVPAHFRFSFKAPQRITHYARLTDCDRMLEEFLRSLDAARDTTQLGVVLFQLPPNFKCDAERLRRFLAAPALSAPGAPRLAFEFRHESWFADPAAEQVRGMLAEHDAALCIAESDQLQSPEWQTAAGHCCYRLRRSGGYKPREIAAFAARFTAQAACRDVYAYFRHEDEPTGALNALALLKAARRPPRKAAQ